MKTYKVSGYAMVPVLAEMLVSAPSPSAALRIAEKRWEAAEGQKRKFIVPGTEDDTAVCDWHPNTIEVNSRS